jgi:hypothetical protein
MLTDRNQVVKQGAHFESKCEARFGGWGGFKATGGRKARATANCMCVKTA